MPLLENLQIERIAVNKSGFAHFEFNFEILELLVKVFTGTTDGSQMKNGLPIIFFGIIPLILVILFFVNKRICCRYKVAVAMLLLAFVLSFWSSALNIIWHGMIDNNCFNYRYSFVFSFICLVVGFFSLLYLKDLKAGDFGKGAGILFLMIILVFNKPKEFVTLSVLYLDIFFLTIGVIFLYCSNRGMNKKAYCVGLSLLILFNITENDAITLNKIMTRFGSAEQSEYNVFYREMGALLSEAASRQIVRMEKTFRRTSCDNMLLGMKGVSNYASTENERSLNFLQGIGMNRVWKECWYNADSPVSVDSLLGIKYLITDDELTRKDYTLISHKGQYYLYQNPYSLPLLIPAKKLDNLISDELDCFERTNRYWQSFEADSKGIIFNAVRYSEDLETIKDQGRMKLEIQVGERGKAVYMYAPIGAYEIKTIVNGKTNIIENSQNQIVYCIGKSDTAQTIEIEILATDDAELDKEKIKLYIEDKEMLEKYIEKIHENEIAIYEKSSSCLEGSYIIKDDAYIITTIPYDAGWTVYEDGKKVEIEKNWNAMLAWHAASGQHHVKMVYFPKGLKEGMIITGISGILALLYLMCEKGKNKK